MDLTCLQVLPMAICASNDSSVDQNSAALGHGACLGLAIDVHRGLDPERQVSVECSRYNSRADTIHDDLGGRLDGSKMLDKGIDDELTVLVASRGPVLLLVVVMPQDAFVCADRILLQFVINVAKRAHKCHSSRGISVGCSGSQ